MKQEVIKTLENYEQTFYYFADCPYIAKIKYMDSTANHLRFPVLRDIVEEVKLKNKDIITIE